MRRTFITTAVTAAALALTALSPASGGPATAPGAAAAGTEVTLVAAAGRCGGKAIGYPNRWGPVSESNCGLLGTHGTRVHYSWSVANAQGQRVCVDGWGFDEANPRGRWFSLGCGTRSIDYSGQGLPWGSVAAVPKIRVKSLNVPLTAGVTWAH